MYDPIGFPFVSLVSRSDLRDLVTFAGQGAKEDHNEDHDQDHAGEDHKEDHSPEIAVTSEDHKITKVTREGSDSPTHSTRTRKGGLLQICTGPPTPSSTRSRTVTIMPTTDHMRAVIALGNYDH